MDDAFFTMVCGGEGVGDLFGDFQGFFNGDRAFLLEPLAERIARDELHDEVVRITGLIEAVDGSDVGVIQRREELGFALKARQAFRIAGELLWQYFDGYIAAKFAVVRLIHLAHATRTDVAGDFVGSKSCADWDGHIFPLTGAARV